ncbi:hypothetical protein SmJEL517_g01953 [Synchytrium microbalum]|uniref:Cytochrome P450 n=1 Tax=Synchytrium microbalum TaxID=1806994 RepID=A0A507C8A3_9FUNG|nr:uncharacterized protein SmJEL517_g01953 [Synchytrium microbalum]TPX35741.1 hypothetical protein SmJEL517_g01953 [Synchytrium microbalum]
MAATMNSSPWMWAVVGVAAVTGLTTYEYWDRAIGTRKRNDIPKLPKHLTTPMLGNAPAVLKRFTTDHLDALNEKRKMIGNVWLLSLPGRQMVITYNVADVECIMKDPYLFVKGEASHKMVFPFFGHGIFAVDGEEWKIQRKTGSNIFTVKNFKDHFGPVFLEESDLMCKHMSESASQNLPIDMQDLLLRCTIDGFARIALGTDVQALRTQGSNVNGKYRLPDVDFMIAFDGLLAILTKRFINPLYHISEMFDGTYGEILKHKSVLDEFALKMIRERTEKPLDKDRLSRPMDLLDFFLAAEVDANSEEYLRDVMLNYIIAGRDTTAQTCSWLLWEVAKHPHVEERLREEFTRILGDGPLDYSNLKDMRFSVAVWHETLRLHGNVPNAIRVATDDVTLPSGTKLLKGDIVQWSSWCMARNEEIWGEDANEFKPERWLNEEGNLIRVSQYQWPVFNCGPRICLGMNMATHEALILMSDIYRRFHLELVNEDDKSKWGVWNEDPAKRRGRYGLGVTLSMRGGVEFKVHHVSK